MIFLFGKIKSGLIKSIVCILLCNFIAFFMEWIPYAKERTEAKTGNIMQMMKL